MKRWIRIAGMAAMLGGSTGVSHAATLAPVSDADAARALIPGYTDATDMRGLQTLPRLQLAAGALDDAEATLERLATAERVAEPRLVPALVPWRVYLRARRHEVKGRRPRKP